MVLTSGTDIVGMAVVQEEEDFEYLRTHYELKPWLDESKHTLGSRGLILHLLISPIFQRYRKTS